MVNTKKKFEEIEHTKIEVPETDIPENEINWCSISLSEIIKNSNRLEASVFKIEARHAREALHKCKYGLSLKKLCGLNSFTSNAFYPNRFKRIYLPKSPDSIPFYLPSQLNEIYPKPNKYISRITDTNIEELKPKVNSILLTRSGTIGNCSYVSKTLSNKVFSDDVIRISFNNYYDCGYIYAFLKTNIGQLLIKTNNYGSVISHIEPKHLENIEIPNPPEILKKEIHNLIVKSYDLRDESNDLIDEAEKLLIQELKLPPIEDFKPKYYNQNSEIRNFEVSLSKLNNRFDASYHVPIVDCIVEHLKAHSKVLKKIGDEDISADVILPGRFARTYVEEGQGVKFIGGKDLLQLNPSTDKYLSKKVHENIIEKQLGIKENDLIMPGRGTIGYTVLAPKHFEGWAISDNLIKVTIENTELVGYIYCYFNSVYGKTLIERQIYGGVVNAIEPQHIREIPIPILNNKDIQDKINALVLQANKKRYEAYILEQKAIKMVNEKVIYTN